MAIDRAGILELILTKRGERRLRKSWPSSIDRSTRLGRHAYFVWRLARFHGGEDVTMPVLAYLFLEDDDPIEELEAMADEVARKYLGTDMAGALTWGRVLGIV